MAVLKRLDVLFSAVSVTSSRAASTNGKVKRKRRKSAKKCWTHKTKKKSKWYVQPLTDEPDSLLYFPHSLVYHCNCGDMESVSQLIQKHFHKKAMVNISGPESISLGLARYTSFLSLTDVLFCDLLSCVYGTTVVGSQIQSRIYYSYTDVAEMYHHAGTVITDPLFKKLFVGKRSELLKRRLKLSTRSADVQARLTPLVESGAQLQVYCRSDVTITFDEYTHKILKMDSVHKIKSVGYNGEKIKL